MPVQTTSATIVVGDGDVPPRAVIEDAWPGWAAGVRRVIGADGGATRAMALGWRPDLVVGDMDSLAGPEAAAMSDVGVRFERWPAHKNRSDLEIALRAALAEGEARVVVLGALGGPRIDHALAALWLLALPLARGRDVTVLDGMSRLRLLHGPGALELSGRLGDLVTLLPFGTPARGVRTSGLAYALDGETLAVGPSRGLSNVRVGERATVRLEQGRLLIVESHRMEVSS